MLGVVLTTVTTLIFLNNMLGISSQKNEEICKGNLYYNDPTFTCCGRELYDGPPPISSLPTDDDLKKCLQQEQIKEAKKLVPKTWMIYECLIKEKIKGAVNIDSFTDLMIQRFKESIQTKIKANIEKVKRVLAEIPTTTAATASRKKREEQTSNEDTTSTTAKNEDSEAKTPTANPETLTTQTEEVTTDPPTTQTEEVTTDPPTTQTEEVTTDPPTTQTEEVTTDPPTTIPPPNYLALSVFKFQKDFKGAIPSKEIENIMEIWDQYYSAELEACHKEAGGNDSTITSIGAYARYCLGWIMKSSRRGGCCMSAPIPLQLVIDHSKDIDYIRNFTAESLLNITGNYIDTNLTVSSNVYRCGRLAKAVLQGEITLDEIKSEIEDFITSNGTKRVIYEDVAKKLIPAFFPGELRDTMIREMLPPKPPKNGEKSYAYYVSIDDDVDLQIISNLQNPVYEWAVASEWDMDTLDVDRTRYLLWTCDAYRIVSQRIALYDTGPSKFARVRCDVFCPLKKRKLPAPNLNTAL